jgi:hypothetical protein
MLIKNAVPTMPICIKSVAGLVILSRSAPADR